MHVILMNDSINTIIVYITIIVIIMVVVVTLQ